MAALVPELLVTDIVRSRAFYERVLGFVVLWERPAEGFVYLARDGAELMLDLVSERTFETGYLIGPLDPPLGRGVSLQIRVSDVDVLYSAVVAAGARITRQKHEAWYRASGCEIGQRQFIVADPDGYLVRFAQSLGTRLIGGTDDQRRAC